MEVPHGWKPLGDGRGQGVWGKGIALTLDFEAVGRPHAVVTHGNLWKHVEASSRTTLRPLGDVIPINVPLLRSVISAGDVLMLLGIALGVAVAMGRPVVPSGTLPRS